MQTQNIIRDEDTEQINFIEQLNFYLIDDILYDTVFLILYIIQFVLINLTKLKYILSNRFTFGEAVFCILKQNHIFTLPTKTPPCKSAQLYTVDGAIASFCKNTRNDVPLISSDKGLTLALLCNYPQ